MKGFELMRGQHAEAGVPTLGVDQASIHSKTAEASWSWLSQRRVSSSWDCMVEENDSIIVLSTLEATRPMEPSRGQRVTGGRMCHSPKRIGPPCCRSMDHLSVRLSMTGSPLGVNGGAGVGVVVVSDACTPDSMETKHRQALLVKRDLHMEEPTATRANRPPVTKVSALADQTPNRRPGRPTGSEKQASLAAV